MTVGLSSTSLSHWSLYIVVLLVYCSDHDFFTTHALLIISRGICDECTKRPLPAERCHLQFWVKMTFWCFLVQIVHFLLLTKLQNWILSTLYVIHEFIKVPFDNSTHFDCIKVTFAYFDCMKVPFAKWNLYALKKYVCFRMVLLHKGAIWQMEPLCTHKIGMLDTLVHVNLEH